MAYKRYQKERGRPYHRISLAPDRWEAPEEVDENLELGTHGLARAMGPEEMAALLDDFLNVGARGHREGLQVGQAMRYSHRTLQRLAIGFALGVICGLADQEYTDARNRTAIETAKKIWDMVNAGDLPLGPFV